MKKLASIAMLFSALVLNPTVGLAESAQEAHNQDIVNVLNKM